MVVTPTSNSLEIYKNALSSCQSTAAGIAGCLGMQVQCIIHVHVIGAMDSQDTTVDDVISCESAAQLKA